MTTGSRHERSRASVTVAPEVAARVVACRAAGEPGPMIARRFHLTLREVAAVLAASAGSR